MTRTTFFLGVLAIGCHSAAPPAKLAQSIDAGSTTATATPLAPKRTVVVTLVVDQLASWILHERLPKLPPDGGFQTLARRGLYVEDMRYAHGVTDTAPGHASLFTGKTPSEHGIVSNELVLKADGEGVSIVHDPMARIVGPSGVMTDRVGSSLVRLAVPTVADTLRLAHPDATIIALSMKDRGAMFGGGHAPNASLWFDTKTGAFISSTAFGEALPSWATQPLAPRAPWTMLDAEWVRANAATVDDAPGEGNWDGLGTTFPHPPAPTWSSFRATPAADAELFALAERALDAEASTARSSENHGPLLLHLSLSATDYIGHTFGPDSWEAWDGLRRLDASLAQFLRSLDARFGEGNYGVLLSADHGVSSMPEARPRRPECQSPNPSDSWVRPPPDRWMRPCNTLPRVSILSLVQLARDGLAKAGHDPSLVLGGADPFLFLAPELRHNSALRGEVVSIVRKKLIGDAVVHSLVAVKNVVDATAIARPCPEDDSERERLCRSIPPDPPVDLYVQLHSHLGLFFDPGYSMNRGANHGTLGLHDRSVPLLLVGPGVAPGTREQTPVPFTRFAEQLRTWLGLPQP